MMRPHEIAEAERHNLANELRLLNKMRPGVKKHQCAIIVEITLEAPRMAFSSSHEYKRELANGVKHKGMSVDEILGSWAGHHAGTQWTVPTELARPTALVLDC